MAAPLVSAHAVDRYTWRVKSLTRPDASQEVMDMAQETYHPHDGAQWVCLGVGGRTLCCMYRGPKLLSVYWMGSRP